MTTDTASAALDVPAGVHESFRVSDPVEVRSLLKSLMDRSVTVNLNGSDGAAYSTTLWALDAAQGKIAFAADMMAPAVHRLVEAEEAMAVGYLDQIKVQFDVADRMLVHGRQHCVLQAAMPRELFRFQRRNAFRVRTLERSAPTARFRHPSIPDMALELRVLDVSVGGCALLMPSDMPMFEPGVQINDCVIELDSGTLLRGSLIVHHVTSIQPHARGVRLGCELRHLEPEATRALQRYIDQTQKRRRMLSLD
ncbi:flagellar brake protein [Ideonella sp. DXS29W]|uniref:Flagellar brake protein YcgR n=1 Tax=Ideonella lacteola TaxID=2984193 RepID=A0ABU9BY21_9BURK